MAEERKQRIEAERLLRGLSTLEVPAALEQRVLSRLWNAQREDAHRVRHGTVRKLIQGMAAMAPIWLLALGVLVFFGHEPQQNLEPPPGPIAGRTLSATSGLNAAGSDLSSSIEARRPSYAAPPRVSEFKKLVTLRLSGDFKVEPAYGVPEQERDDSSRPKAVSAFENAFVRRTNAGSMGTALQSIGDGAVPGDRLPTMRAATIPGEPLPRFEVAAAPGTPLPGFAQATSNGDYQ